ncbi:Lrp/AsnC ligand binding domain-containing protein [Nocardia sp. NBC_01377]|uniref:Lrp/AsnC ligand binding domain-containing protein n=1 Tax=Nocardia sp. NBC_01377 TaxID=2903595 RepID=UPI0038687B81
MIATSPRRAASFVMNQSSSHEPMMRTGNQRQLRHFWSLTAFIRVRLTIGTGKLFHEFLDNTPQILEAHHLTGEDCFLLEVVARSMPDLESLAEKLVTFGHVTTNLVFSSPADRRALPPSA